MGGEKRGLGWAIVALAVLLTFQQYDLLLVPLAAAWTDFGVKRTAVSVGLAAAFIAPWALAAPHASFRVRLFTSSITRLRPSLSLFHRLSEVSGALAYGVLVAGVGIALAGRDGDGAQGSGAF